MKLTKILCFAVIALALSACGSKDKEADDSIATVENTIPQDVETVENADDDSLGASSSGRGL